MQAFLWGGQPESHLDAELGGACCCGFCGGLVYGVENFADLFGMGEYSRTSARLGLHGVRTTHVDVDFLETKLFNSLC